MKYYLITDFAYFMYILLGSLIKGYTKMLQTLQERNQQLAIKSINNTEFYDYGQPLHDFNFYSLIEYTDTHARPTDGVTYKTLVEEMQNQSIKQSIQRTLFGGMLIQIGWCYGYNTKLNALEYHKSSEVIVAVSDLLLLLGKKKDIKNDQYPTQKVVGFYMQKGEAVELYSTSLHYAPVQTNKSGFKSIIILPQSTNEPLDFIPDKNGEGRFLTHKNKWLLAHPDSSAAQNGAYVGLIGDNIEVSLP